MICGHRARVATGMASPRHRVIQPFAAEGARLDELDAGGAATASRRRFLPQLSGGPISAPGVVDAHLCARRGAMTSSSLTANCPSAPRIGMLCVEALHGADISRTAARKRQMRAPRGCFRPACLGLLHLDTRFFRRVSRVPNTSSRTVSYGQKPLPYNTSAKGKLLASGERSSRPSLHLNKRAAQCRQIFFDPPSRPSTLTLRPWRAPWRLTPHNRPKSNREHKTLI